MINLMIVDDENIAREGLKNSISWNELGIDAVETAKNGMDALKLAESFIPDLILCDVRMPKMNGLVFSSKIHELHPSCKIIFMSAFSDKEYLKSAIRLGAFDYLEKPLDVDTVKTVVRSALHELRKSNEKAMSVNRIARSLNESSYLLCQEALLSLLTSPAGLDNLLEKYDYDFLKFPADGMFTYAAVLINWSDELEDSEIIYYKNSVLKIINQNNVINDVFSLGGFVDDSTMIIIIGNEPDSACIDNVKVFSALMSELLLYGHGVYTISIGYEKRELTLRNIADDYRSAIRSTVIQQFYLGINRIFQFSDMVSKTFMTDNDLFASFENMLRGSSAVDSIHIVIALTRNIRFSLDTDIEKIKDIYFRLTLLLFEEVKERSIMFKLEEGENRYVWQEINRLATLDELSEYVVRNLNSFINILMEKNSTKSIIYDITTYINTHYADSKLSIRSIATRFHLSQSYLCALFKKAKGITVNDYTCEVRIKRAKDFLRDRNIRLYEVAEKIGLSDANYFSILFKKYVGCTPSEFKERIAHSE